MNAVTPISAAVPELRPIPAVQRAYFYLVSLVAIHMVVLAVANLLRVGAEMAMNAPSGGFTGLPFVFNEFSRPSNQYREQASLAIALLVVGLPAWLIHFSVAQRAAGRAIEERASSMRSFYLHLVVVVTALLVFGYGQRALRLVLQGNYIGETSTFGPGAFGLEAHWQARAAGAAAMALTSAAVLAFHLWLSNQDRRIAIGTTAAQLRHLGMYLLLLVGLAWVTFTTVSTLTGIWDYVADAIAPLSGPVGRFNPPPGVVIPPQPSRDDYLRFQLIGAVPAILAGLALWLGTWIPLQRGLRSATADGEVERRSTIRKLAIYLVVFISAVQVLFGATIGLSQIVERALGTPEREQYRNLTHDLGGPIITLVVFGAVWLFHRRVVHAEAARETEVERAATIRRVYTYLIAAIGLGMLAFGTAGAIGVLGSQVIGTNTHGNGETAGYISLVLVGSTAWAFNWWQAQRRLDDDERRSLPRRAYLYLAILGGVLGVLVFGSAGLYRVLNAALAASFPLATWHDIWHFAVDAAVSAGAFLYHLRVVRADRAAQLPTVPQQAVTVLVRAVDVAAARARLAAALEGQADITIR
ncbi:MAG TPA: DUF5671 domain-containing protein [Candidatus Limnocylindria bacterium]|nr:DUF5671 domain-containing protein [Candidatus Limnocylindria bacterium]